MNDSGYDLKKKIKWNVYVCKLVRGNYCFFGKSEEMFYCLIVREDNGYFFLLVIINDNVLILYVKNYLFNLINVLVKMVNYFFISRLIVI